MKLVILHTQFLICKPTHDVLTNIIILMVLILWIHILICLVIHVDECKLTENQTNEKTIEHAVSTDISRFLWILTMI